MNQGVTSHIGPTYTLASSSIASMKGQDTPNTYCQPGTAIDPATPAGLKFGQSLGGINSVKQTYDQINRLSNDNTQPNSARAIAIEQCYGVSIDKITHPINKVTPSMKCPDNKYIYGQSAGGFCCPVPPTTPNSSGEFTVCPEPSGICSLGPNTQGNPRC
jgi:hypothetical protein